MYIACAKACVYVSRYFYGSPAGFYDLKAKCWMQKVNKRAVHSLDDFLECVLAIEESKYVVIDTIDCDGKMKVITIKADKHYWPTIDYAMGADGWSMHRLD